MAAGKKYRLLWAEVEARAYVAYLPNHRAQALPRSDIHRHQALAVVKEAGMC